MSTWAEYKARITAWSKAPSPEAIPWDDVALLGYERASRQIQPAELDTHATIDPALGVNVRDKVWSHAAPTDLLRIISLTDRGERVRSYNTGALQELDGSAPFGHAVVGANIWVAPGVGSSLELIYNKRDSLPAQDSETNHGLTEYSDAYLAAGLIGYYQYVEDLENEQAALGRFNALADTLNALAERKRRGGGAGGVR